MLLLLILRFLLLEVRPSRLPKALAAPRGLEILEKECWVRHLECVTRDLGQGLLVRDQLHPVVRRLSLSPQSRHMVCVMIDMSVGEVFIRGLF